MSIKIDGTNGVLQSYDYQVMTTGFSYTFASGITNLIMNPAGTLATGTITMPALPVDGMTITFSSTQTITALTVNGNSGQTVVGAPTTLTAGAVVVLVYRLSATTWITQVNTNSSGATGDNTMNVYSTPGTSTWTKPSSIKSIKVTVVGGGGPGGTASTTSPGFLTQSGGGGGGGTAVRYYPGPSLPGPQPYTVGAAGGTSSFGVAPITVVTATGGSTQPATNTPSGGGGAGGTGSNGTLNLPGGDGSSAVPTGVGQGGSSTLSANFGSTKSFGGGGGGSSAGPAAPTSSAGAAGAGGVVIIEEFY